MPAQCFCMSCYYTFWYRGRWFTMSWTLLEWTNLLLPCRRWLLCSFYKLGMGVRATWWLDISSFVPRGRIIRERHAMKREEREREQVYRMVESQNCWDWKDVCRPASPTPLPKGLSARANSWGLLGSKCRKSSYGRKMLQKALLMVCSISKTLWPSLAFQTSWRSEAPEVLASPIYFAWH